MHRGNSCGMTCHNVTNMKFWYEQIPEYIRIEKKTIGMNTQIYSLQGSTNCWNMGTAFRGSGDRERKWEREILLLSLIPPSISSRSLPIGRLSPLPPSLSLYFPSFSLQFIPSVMPLSPIYGICREYQKSRTYAFRGNNSEWSHVPRKPHNLCSPEPLSFIRTSFLSLWAAPVCVFANISRQPSIQKDSTSIWTFKENRNSI